MLAYFLQGVLFTQPGFTLYSIYLSILSIDRYISTIALGMLATLGSLDRCEGASELQRQRWDKEGRESGFSSCSKARCRSPPQRRRDRKEIREGKELAFVMLGGASEVNNIQHGACSLGHVGTYSSSMRASKIWIPDYRPFLLLLLLHAP